MKEDRIYIQHILEAIRKINRYIRDLSYESFTENDMATDAVVRELEIIGEAVSNISKKFQEEHPDLPFNEMTGMRNVLIHEYFNVDTEIVWKTCKEDLPKLEKELMRVNSD